MTKCPVRLYLLLLCCASSARTQVTDLASNLNGSELYFSAPASLRGTNAPRFSKIFRWSAAQGLEVYASRERVLAGRLTNYYALTGPSVSSDGNLIAFSA